MHSYDVVIIGSGLGGLACGVTLSKEGFRVCVVEKNARPGGCFQTFNRNGYTLDTGIHYIGSMDEGEILRQYFRYFGIMDRLNLRRMDEEAFDVIHYKGKEYSYAMGHDRFAEQLAAYFPQEKAAIRQYVSLLKKVGDTIHPDRLKQGQLSTGGLELFSVSAWDTICSLTTNADLRQVLSGPALLYGGEQSASTFYHHAIITNSYLQGAWRFVDGSMQLVNAMTDIIRQHGGTIRTHSEVTRLCLSGDRIQSVEINGEEQIAAKQVISSLHPSITMQLVEKTPFIKKAYLSRLSSLRNSYGLLSVYLLKEKQQIPYHNRNHFLYEGDNIWETPDWGGTGKIHSCMISMQASSQYEDYTDVISLISPMFFDEVKPWEHTRINRREGDYLVFKEKKAEELIRYAANYYPGIEVGTKNIVVTTPLSYRDYTGIPEGSAYGIIKNYARPLTTIIPPRTRIPNLFLTGQNLNVHGALGVTLTSMLTCAELLGKEYLARKIGEV